MCKGKFEQRKDGRPKTCSKSCARRLDAQRNGGHSHNYRDGRWIDNKGYVRTLVKGHHRSDSRGYVLEHIVVMEKKIGRPLVEGERVHHKNGIRDDNRKSNLELWCVLKKDPAGSRVADMIKYVTTHHTEAVKSALAKL